VLFARNALCIVTDASRPLDGGNLAETLLKPDIRIGTSTPVADPAGDYTWEMFHLIEAQRPGAFEILAKKAQQLFGNATTPVQVNGRPRWLAALDDHEVDLLITYCSSAKQIAREEPNYKSVELPPQLSVGPEYGLTVSRNAAPGAAAFAMYLLSPQGQSSLKSSGFIPVALPASK
jgi:ABC-type molybdate transport system substrate-binding protein